MRGDGRFSQSWSHMTTKMVICVLDKTKALLKNDASSLQDHIAGVLKVNFNHTLMFINYS